MRAVIATMLVVSSLAVATHSGRVDPRSPALRASLAQTPGVSRALWVYFDTAHARGEGPVALGRDALRARLRTRIPLLHNDHALPRRVIDDVLASGARIRHTSRWLRAVSVMADSVVAERLARTSGVIGIEPVASLRAADVPRTADEGPSGAAPVPDSLPARRATATSLQAFDSTFYGPNWPAINRLGIASAHRVGATGRGVRIAILDTGFERQHESFSRAEIIAARDFINGDTIVSDQPGESGSEQERHGTRVWSILGGYSPGTLVGPAYDAEFLLAKVDQEPNDTRADEDRWVAGIEWADSMGARIVQSSVVFRSDFIDRTPIPFAELNGQTTVTTRAAREAARRGILVVTAIGDEGSASGSLSAPADADSVISVGSVDPSLQVSAFSARGPTADGRIKPELVARGTGLIGASSLSPGAFDVGLSGTSYSAPLIAGAAALLLEAWPDLSPSAARSALIRAASHANSPGNEQGYGVPDVASAILYPEGIVPVSVADIDLDGMLTTIAPRFTWNPPRAHPAATSVLFRVEVATDSLFQNIVLSDTIRDALSYASRSALKPSAQLWWRVRADAPFGVRRTSTSMGPFGLPRWVRLVTPDPDQATFVQTAQPDLTWVPLTAPPPVGPLVYDVEVLSNQTGQLVQPTIRNITSSVVRLPQQLVPNQAYRWRVIVRSALASADTVESRAPFWVETTDRPPITLLQQNFPNPFPRADLGAAETQIWFDLTEETHIELAVFDQRGRFVKQLIPATPDCGVVRRPPGYYGRPSPFIRDDDCMHTSWDGTDHAGRTVPAGVYILRLRAGGRDHIRHMVFLGR